jgi:hypothetical protein
MMSPVGTFETSRDVRSLAAIGGKAEVARTSSNRRDWHLAVTGIRVKGSRGLFLWTRGYWPPLAPFEFCSGTFSRYTLVSRSSASLSGRKS